MDAALPEAEREVVVAAEPCGHGSKFEDIYRLLAEGCFPPSFCSIKRKNLKRYAQKFVVDGGDRGRRGAVGLPWACPGGGGRCRPRTPGDGCAGGSACGGDGALGSAIAAAAPRPGPAPPHGHRGGRVSPGSTGASRLPPCLCGSGGFHSVLGAEKRRGCA